MYVIISLSIHIYIYIHIYVYTHVYIYIYIERERDIDTALGGRRLRPRGGADQWQGPQLRYLYIYTNSLEYSIPVFYQILQIYSGG